MATHDRFSDPQALQALFTTRMPYGKYEGRAIADLPGHYLHWMAREGFPAGRLGALLALMFEIDHNGLEPLLAPMREAHEATMHGPMHRDKNGSMR